MTPSEIVEFKANLTVVTTDGLYRLHEEWMAEEGLIGPHIDLVMNEIRDRKLV